MLNISFTFNITEFSPVSYCNLTYNNSLNQSRTDVVAGLNQSFYLFNATEGNSTWQVSCQDNSTAQLTGAGTPFHVAIDTTPPSIILGSLPNNTESYPNIVQFLYTPTDNNDVMNCSLIVNGANEETNQSINDGQIVTVNRTFSGANYTWFVNCSDQANNFGLSETRTFSIRDPDRHDGCGGGPRPNGGA